MFEKKLGAVSHVHGTYVLWGEIFLVLKKPLQSSNTFSNTWMWQFRLIFKFFSKISTFCVFAKIVKLWKESQNLRVSWKRKVDSLYIHCVVKQFWYILPLSVSHLEEINRWLIHQSKALLLYLIWHRKLIDRIFWKWKTDKRNFIFWNLGCV